MQSFSVWKTFSEHLISQFCLNSADIFCFLPFCSVLPLFYLYRVCFLHVVKGHIIYNFGGLLHFLISIKTNFKIKSLGSDSVFLRKNAHHNQFFCIKCMKIIYFGLLDILLHIQPVGEPKEVLHT